jgi:hypothetical protein
MQAEDKWTESTEILCFEAFSSIAFIGIASSFVERLANVLGNETEGHVIHVCNWFFAAVPPLQRMLFVADFTAIGSFTSSTLSFT